MKRVLAGLAAGVMWLWTATPAAAQSTYDELTDDQLSELYCVADYLDLFTGPDKVVDVYMSSDPEKAGFADVDADVQEASATCTEEYDWSVETAGTMTAIGLYSLMGDEMELRLGEAGVDQAGIDAIYRTTEALSDDDLGAFADGNWFDNAPLRQRVTDALTKTSLSDDDVIMTAMFLMEAYVIVAVSLEEWLSTLGDS